MAGVHGHVSPSPPTIPDGRISRVRFGPWLSSGGLPKATRLKRWPTYTPDAFGLPLGLVPAAGVGFPWLCVQAPTPGPPSAQSPFARPRRYLRRDGVSRAASKGVTLSSSLLRAHAPDPIPPVAYGHRLGRRVLAGGCQPLLGEGPSRRCLRASFPRCLGPYPGAPRGALARFFPRDYGLPHLATGSARRHPHTATSVWNQISRLQPFLYVQAPGFARHSGSLPPRLLLPRRDGRGFYFRAEHGSLPSRASDRLTVRTGQLTAWGLSPHKMRGLVGRSCNIGVNVPPASIPSVILHQDTLVLSHSFYQ